MFLPAGVAVLLLLAIVAAVLWLALRPHPERDAAAALSWAAFHQHATTNGWLLLYVQTVYQHAHRGSKALVSIYRDPTSASRDAWFWWHQVQPGSVVAVHLNQGWGPHTCRDDVLYIGRNTPTPHSGIYATFSTQELTRAQRHFRRHPPLGCSGLAAA
jgi:hypothetical protein